MKTRFSQIAAACLLVFGTSEFVYAKFIAAMVPGWLPPSQFFWTYATVQIPKASPLLLTVGGAQMGTLDLR